MTTTYIPLATTTLASATNTVTLSSISASYTDLVLVINYQASGGAVYAQYRLNGDSGSNYRRNVISGNGSTAGNYNSGSESYMYAANTIYAGSGQWATLISNFNNYSNTTTNKTAIHRFSEATIGTEATISSWNSTAAINSITINTNAHNFGIGSTFSLYGIASAAISGAKATGGDTIATDGTYWYHAFRASGTFTPSVALTADVLVVAGGGSGGSDVSGGGGAGGVIAFASQSLSSAQTVTVGGGGAGNVGKAESGAAGGNSQFGSLTAAVGGGRGTAVQTATGGSGGGNRLSTGGTATAGQGNTGGGGSNAAPYYPAGGGGGAGGVGQTGSGSTGGAGGAGTNSVTNWGALAAALTTTGLGVSGYIAGGGGAGGGGSYATPGAAGSGGATAGSATTSSNATANTGSGSGGASDSGGNTGNGGSGLVIVRYPI